MKFKALGLMGIGLAASAFAVVVVVGAKGAGEATNAAGKKGGFNIDVSKSTDGTLIRFNGTASFTTRITDANNNPGTLTVTLRQVKRLGKNGPKVEAEGLGVHRVQFGSNVRQVEGNVKVTVQDLRNPTTPNGRDTFAIAFRPRPNTTGPSFDFVGRVTSGDLAVFERTLAP